MLDFTATPKKKKKTRRWPLLLIALVVLAGAVVLVSGAPSAPAALPPATPRVTPTSTAAALTSVDARQWNEAQAILAQVNAARQASGAGGLSLNARLMAAALRHSQDMAAGGFASHTGSDGSTLTQRADRAGYVYRSLGENVLMRPDQNPAGAFDQWWNSPPHRANLLNPDFTEVGVAFAVAADGSHYYTMLLGTPLS